MARKHLIYSYPFFNSQTVTSSVQSNTTVVSQLDYGSIAITWSASDLTADIKIQARNGEKEPFYDLPLGSVPQITGASGSHLIVLNAMPFTDLRVAITVNSGTTAVVDAVLTAKSLGA